MCNRPRARSAYRLMSFMRAPTTRSTPPFERWFNSEPQRSSLRPIHSLIPAAVSLWFWRRLGNVHLSPEAEAYFAKKGCKVPLQPTPEAIGVFNRSHAKKIGLFHVTC